jgi:FAD/FMN-containing dehydrogenase
MSIDHLAIRPGDAEYDTARTTIVGVASPAEVLRPSTPSEVAACLHHARRQGLAVAVRGGGHHALGYGNLDDGAVLDLSRLDTVEVLDGGRVRVGGGATWGHVARELAPHGLAVTSGDTGSVGVGGLTQAGGMGWMVRKHGLTIDSLVAAEVVTASGQVVRADAVENADLFWAIRGGAGNVGVVTAFDLVAQEVRTLHYGTIGFALDDVPGLLSGWSEVMAAAPDELTSMLVLRPGFGDFPPGAVLYLAHCGEDPSPIDALRHIGTVVSDDVAVRAYADVLEEAHPPQGVLPVIGNTLVETVAAPVVDAVAAAYAGGGRVVFLRSLGGAVGRVPDEATAFAHRRAQAMIVSAAFLPLDAGEDQVAAARAVWRTIGDHGIGSYAGFLGSDTAEDVASVWPEATLRRLREAKRAWDPDNVFRHNLNVVP